MFSAATRPDEQPVLDVCTTCSNALHATLLLCAASTRKALIPCACCARAVRAAAFVCAQACAAGCVSCVMRGCFGSVDFGFFGGLQSSGGVIGGPISVVRLPQDERAKQSLENVMQASEEIGQPPPGLESPPRARDRVCHEGIDPLAKEACAGGQARSRKMLPSNPLSLLIPHVVLLSVKAREVHVHRAAHRCCSVVLVLWACAHGA